jgi:diaminohydroxyphosphoribosylaminopyrimidine deaminase/5-amino-6-(5-phosphoribosylamino)uracil reductase
LPGMFARSPVRVILDAKFRIPLSTAIVGTAREMPVWVFGEPGASPVAEGILKSKGAEVFRVDANDGRLDLASVLKILADRGITRLMVEGGPTVAAAFLAADLVDQAALFRSPNEIGHGGIAVLEGMPLTALTKSSKLKQVANETVGVDTLDLFERAGA